MTTKKESGTGSPLDLTSTFSMEVAWVKAHLSEFFKGMKGIRRVFTAASKAGNYGINKDLMIVLVAEALKQERIEPYQASLLLATNLSEPISDEGKLIKKWDDFLERLISIHTDTTSFNRKRQTLLILLMENGLENYDSLRRVGLARNYFHPEDPDYVDTLEDVLHHNNDNIPHDRRPADIMKESVEEKLGDVPVKTYAAISKDTLMPLLKEAMHEKRMNYVQAAAMLAINCHAMEKRRSGERYLDHIMAVAGAPGLTPRQRVVAIMHDVIENSNYTVADLKEMGFPNSLIRSLEHITKRPDERVYLKFIERLSNDADALAVKMADIRHNSSDPAQTDKEKLKREKYQIALSYLDAVKCGEIEAGSSIEEYAHEIGFYKSIHFRSEPKKQPHSDLNGELPTPSAPPGFFKGAAPI